MPLFRSHDGKQNLTGSPVASSPSAKEELATAVMKEEGAEKGEMNVMAQQYISGGGK